MAALKCSKCQRTTVEAGKSELRRCARCKSVYYCNRDCQTAHWKVHKKECSKLAKQVGENGCPELQYISAANRSLPPAKGLEGPNLLPFTRLDHGKYLFDRSKKDVYRLLVDSFRIRQADEYKFESKVTLGSIYAGCESSLIPFQDYLAIAATRNVLPQWWNDDKQSECETFAETDPWSNLRPPVTKESIMTYYGDTKMPMQLRMLAEQVYGYSPMGQDSTPMREMMVQIEAGKGPKCVTHLSVSWAPDR